MDNSWAVAAMDLVALTPIKHRRSIILANGILIADIRNSQNVFRDRGQVSGSSDLAEDYLPHSNPGG